MIALQGPYMLVNQKRSRAELHLADSLYTTQMHCIQLPSWYIQRCSLNRKEREREKKGARRSKGSVESSQGRASQDPEEKESQSRPPPQCNAKQIWTCRGCKRFQQYLMSWRPEPGAAAARRRQLQPSVSSLLGLQCSLPGRHKRGSKTQQASALGHLKAAIICRLSFVKAPPHHTPHTLFPSFPSLHNCVPFFFCPPPFASKEVLLSFLFMPSIN